MTTLDAAGFFHNAQVTGVFNDAFMGLILVNGQGVPEMAGGAAQHFGVMGRIELFGFVAGETHLNLAGCGLVEPVGPLGHVLPDHQDQDNDEKKEKKKTGGH